MTAVVQVVDESLSGERRPAVTLRLVSEKVSARELVRQRVEHEVAAYNTHLGEVYQGLVQPTEAESTLNGYRMRRPRPLDPQQQVEVAWAAFERNGFVMLVDDRQVESLDDELVLSPGTVISFIKLVPLVGG
jgi:hypothetical protein